MKYLRLLYDRTLALAAHPQALWWLGFISFIESSIFPIPPDALLIPMILAAPQRAFRIATVCTLSSVAGGLAGYGIGFFLFDAIGQPIVDLYGAGAALDGVRADFAEHGWWIVLGGGITPFPYKLVTIASGALALDPVAFVIASVFGRGVRFFLLALLLWKFGPSIRVLIEKYFGILAGAAFLLLIGGFFLLKVIL